MGIPAQPMEIAVPERAESSTEAKTATASPVRQTERAGVVRPLPAATPPTLLQGQTASGIVVLKRELTGYIPEHRPQAIGRRLSDRFAEYPLAIRIATAR